MQDIPNRQVARRHVFYIPGYDPIHPRRYRELYRKESAAQAEISGYRISQSAKTGAAYGWRARAEIDGDVTQADIEVLVWSDIVRDSMSNSIPATYLQLLQTAWAYIGSGALWRLMKLRKGPVIAALYPVIFLLIQALIALTIGYVLGRGIQNLAGVLNAPEWFAALAGAGVGVALVAMVLRWFRGKDGTFFAYYLMHDYAFSARWKGANPPALEARLQAFADQIEAALACDVDEVLVVGHSSGAHLAISVLADMLRAARVPDDGPVLSFLSLGHVVPMMSFLPKADRLRADLHYMAAQDRIAWVDVTAPGDGCTFALCDPVAVSGVAPAVQTGPLVISAAFTQTLSAARWKALRWRFFRLHFQYLCAFDRPKDYDYFKITCGAQLLGKRYENRVSSKSTITLATSKYRSMS